MSHPVRLSVASLALVSACTVRPLYSNAPLTAGSTVGAAAELASISVKPVKTRYAQQVRNNLIFGFGRGAVGGRNIASVRLHTRVWTQSQPEGVDSCEGDGVEEGAASLS